MKRAKVSVDTVLVKVINQLIEVSTELLKSLEEKSSKIDFSAGDDTWFDYRPDGIATARFLLEFIEEFASGENSLADLEHNKGGSGETIFFQDLVTNKAKLAKIVGFFCPINRRDDPIFDADSKVGKSYQAGRDLRDRFYSKNTEITDILDFWQKGENHGTIDKGK